MDKSLLVRKRKMLARAKIKKLVSMGKLRPKDFTLAATNDGGWPTSPLIFAKFKIALDESW